MTPGASEATAGHPPPQVPILAVERISRAFPGVQALQDVSLELSAGSVHGLVGENGAGKSTLVQIISGAVPADSGRLLFNGEELRDLSRLAATRLGIRPVYQHDILVANLTVAECMFFDRPPRRSFGRVDWARMRELAADALKVLGSDIRPSARVGSLSPAQREIVSIAAALTGQLALLILDEPTALLTVAETHHLYDVIRRLAQRGVAVLYISHRLQEIFDIGDWVTVLKDGRVTGTASVAEMTPNRLVSLMVGRELSFERQPSASVIDGPPALEVRGISAPPRVQDVSFTVRKGEIVCLAGLIGSGRTEACEVVFGARPKERGTVYVDGSERRITSPADAIAAGVAMVPEDRHEAGLLPAMNIVENLIVSNIDRLTRRGLVLMDEARRIARSYVDLLRIVPADLNRKVDLLSGGNQQKVLLAKWLARTPSVLIVDEPSRGVDVGARADIYRLLRDRAREGMAILVVSSDLPEVLTLADRIVVMRDGRTVAIVDGDTATEESIVALAAGHDAPGGAAAA